MSEGFEFQDKFIQLAAVFAGFLLTRPSHGTLSEPLQSTLENWKKADLPVVDLNEGVVDREILGRRELGQLEAESVADPSSRTDKLGYGFYSHRFVPYEVAPIGHRVLISQCRFVSGILSEHIHRKYR